MTKEYRAFLNFPNNLEIYRKYNWDPICLNFDRPFIIFNINKWKLLKYPIFISNSKIDTQKNISKKFLKRKKQLIKSDLLSN